MDSRGKPLPRRKPVPTHPAIRFDDFDLRPLNPAYLEHTGTKIHPAEPSATQKPGLDARGRHVEIPPHHASAIQFWTPFFRRRVVLGGFAALFVGLMIVLAALYGYSQVHQGLSSANQNNYYLWTYGPTAAFTPIAAFWGQVVYRTLQLAPWEAMAARPQPATKSVSLDYISPISLVALYKAAKNLHYPVCLVLLSSLLLTGITVVSTGLFSLQYAEIVTQGATLSTTNKFDIADFDWSTTDARPAAIVYAALDLGLAYPSGTTAQYAVQDIFKVGGSDVTLEATVDSFSAYLECEPASLTVINVSELALEAHLFHSSAFFTFNFTSSSCTATNETLILPVSFDLNTPYNVTSDFIWGFGHLIDCIQESQSRVLVSVGTCRADVIWNGTDADGQSNLLLPWNQMFKVINSTNVFCTPKYEILPARVSKISNSTSPEILGSITPLGRGTSLPGKGMDIARAVFQSINQNTNLIEPITYVNGTDYTSDFGEYGTEDTLFAILERENPFYGDVIAADEFWLQSNNLVRETNVVYGSIAAQVAAQKLLVASTGDVIGKVTSNEPRLFVRTFSFALMEAGLGLISLLATYLSLRVPKSILRQDPGPIAGMAAILSKSPDLMELVSNTATQPSTVTNALLLDHTYYTDMQHGTPRTGGICVSKGSARGDQVKMAEPEPRNTSMTWWQPLILRRWSQPLVVLIPLIYAAILEILLRVSESNDGLLGIDNNSWVHYGWTYIPALLMVCVQMLYASASFSIRLLSPYFMLHRGSAPAPISVTDHAISRTPIHELFVSARRGQKAVVVITVAILLAPLLTIAVSGLYNPETYAQNVGVRVLTGWNFNAAHFYPNSTLVQNVFDHMNESNPADVTMESLGMLTTDLIVTANLSYPKWSYEELALPVIEVTSRDHDNQIVSSQGTSFEVSLPAVRGALNCTIIERQNVEITYATWNSSFTTCTYNSTTNIQTCPAAYNFTYGAGMAGNRACLNSQSGTDGCRVAIFSTNTSQELGGCTFPKEVVFLPNGTTDAQGFGYFAPLYTTLYGQSQTYCPLYGGMVGSTTSTEVEDYTWFVCATTVQRVTAHATFTLPNYDITQASADETTASPISGNATMEINNLPTVFTGANAALLSDGSVGSPTDANTLLTFYDTPTGQNLDNFVSSLVHGTHGVPLAQLIGTANHPRLLAAVEHLWRVIYAQTFRTSAWYLSANARDVAAWTPAEPLGATVVDPRALRLRQSVLATRILQGILAAVASVVYCCCGGPVGGERDAGYGG
ncbi:hypothetical protein CLAIMM_13628 [Cladophialophora immunda]|nr:hypothetical protein CLAIMM_13628 [Cladophialophora immunda]